DYHRPMIGVPVPRPDTRVRRLPLVRMEHVVDPQQPVRHGDAERRGLEWSTGERLTEPEAGLQPGVVEDLRDPLVGDAARRRVEVAGGDERPVPLNREVVDAVRDPLALPHRIGDLYGPTGQ